MLNRNSAFGGVKFHHVVCNINTGLDRIISLEMMCILVQLPWRGAHLGITRMPFD